MGLKDCLMGAVPFAAMVMVECTDVGIATLSKGAMEGGMSNLVFIVYYNGLGTLLLLPSFIFRRNKRPPLTFPLLCSFFLLGLIGICFRQIFAFTGIRLSSPTLATAMGNLIPAFTFVFAVVFRMEKLDLRSSSSQAKCLGTIVTISGAFMITLYKGPAIVLTSPAADPSELLLHWSQSNWVLGGLFLAITCVFSSTWNILQTAIVKKYPDETTIIFFYCLFGTIQCAVVAFSVERDTSAWRLKPDIGLIAILYSAVFGSVFTSSIQTWCLRKKGPVYVAVYKPLGMVIAVIMGVAFLGDVLHIGSVIGAVIIVLGFYSVLWGKAKEEKVVEDNGVYNLGSSTQKTPLLPRMTEQA